MGKVILPVKHNGTNVLTMGYSGQSRAKTFLCQSQAPFYKKNLCSCLQLSQNVSPYKMIIENTLSEVLSEIESIPWEYDLYIRELSANSPAMVLNEENEELDDNEQVIVAKEKGMTLFLSIQTVQSIISNLKAQTPNPSSIQKLKALNYYYENDAFIDYKGLTN